MSSSFFIRLNRIVAFARRAKVKLHLEEFGFLLCSQSIRPRSKTTQLGETWVVRVRKLSSLSDKQESFDDSNPLEGGVC